MQSTARTRATTGEGGDEAPVARAIARAAARLFAERGYDATAVREIVEAAGITKPTLYYHFGSKQGLGEAILTRPMARMAARLEALGADEALGAEPTRLLAAIFQANIDFVVDDPDRARFVFSICFGPAGSSFRDEVHRYGEAFRRSLLDAAGRLAAAGVIDPARAEGCAEVAKGLIMSATLGHIFERREIPEGLADRLVGDLLGGFARRPGTGLDSSRSGS